jgi:hypothetical protein
MLQAAVATMHSELIALMEMTLDMEMIMLLSYFIP